MTDPATTSLLDRANLDRDPFAMRSHAALPAPTTANCSSNTARPKR